MTRRPGVHRGLGAAAAGVAAVLAWAGPAAARSLTGTNTAHSNAATHPVCFQPVEQAPVESSTPADPAVTEATPDSADTAPAPVDDPEAQPPVDTGGDPPPPPPSCSNDGGGTDVIQPPTDDPAPLEPALPAPVAIAPPAPVTVTAPTPATHTTPPTLVGTLTSQLQLADAKRPNERSGARGAGFRSLAVDGLHAAVLFGLGIAALLAYTLIASITTRQRPAFAFVTARRPSFGRLAWWRVT